MLSKPMNKLLNWFKILDKNILKILFIFFILFIPLYPKFPLFDIEYTYIYIRFEDFFVVFITAIFLIQLLRKRITLNKKFLVPIILFWLADFLSFLCGYYYLKTIPVDYIGFLHAARRIEYMIIFLIVSSLIKSKKDFFFYFKFILSTLFIVAFYGLGQKFFGWPAVQTMNPEYAKGYLLFLTPEARISSTFAGHYDLASYIVFFIPLVLSFYFLKKQFRYFLLFIFCLTTLVFTASRVSYIAYIVSTLPFLIFLKKPKVLVTVIILTIGLTLLSNNLTSRLKRTFQVKRIFVNQKTGEVFIPQTITSKELPAGSFYVRLNNQRDLNDNDAYKQSIIEEKEKQLKKQGIILSDKERADMIASLSANLKPMNTILSDISFATRLQLEWPRAIKAFLKNPLLGTGPSSITEATDNDYLRWLGEFGFVGTALFLTILFLIAKTIFQSAKISHQKQGYLWWGFLFGYFALLINASYIDVFEASKVAYNFWLVSGMFIALTKKSI
ncbi:hypothetical protein COY89_01050 [Candidatus Roizmanbacteria bacterium CG_4_10_14_0_8_um_filter_36_36]|nr:MAG: hypothetical protein COY89_01050 [Candidatus Roizmanbacteria bacterium CG_4_10_14_0_8_um_filter_36_36]PJA53698.1 MAG: hypothetical protein CO166_00950 [Candidatus Roizmanbacteria bacterium CG_4_9_14_3_um_filter_36_11]